MKSSIATGVFSATLAAAFAFTQACSSDSADQLIDAPESDQDGGFDSQPSPESGLGILAFMPNETFSGYDGTHTFKVPIAVYDSSSDLTVTVVDPSSADVVPTKLVHTTRADGTTDNGKYFLVTVKKPETITLKATSKGKTVESTLHVTSYAADRWAIGEARYKSSEGGDPPCTSCHVDGQAIDHSPAALATSTDEKIAVVITTGISTQGFPIKIDGKPSHKWTVTAAERDGLVTYLRGLEPKGFE